jgi:protein SCO1/2
MVPGWARVGRRAALTGLGLVLGLLIAACGTEVAAAPAGIVRSPAPEVGAIQLPDASVGGEPFAMKAQPGELLMVYFGYTSCPDICPTTLADLKSAVADLGEDAARVEVAMVTIDPSRDEGEILDRYIHAFFDRAHALRTENESELRRAADAFGADYEVSADADGEVEVAHTAFLYAVDSAGRILLQWPFGISSEDLRKDMEYLFEGGV